MTMKENNKKQKMPKCQTFLKSSIYLIAANCILVNSLFIVKFLEVKMKYFVCSKNGFTSKYSLGFYHTYLDCYLCNKIKNIFTI